MLYKIKYLHQVMDLFSYWCVYILYAELIFQMLFRNKRVLEFSFHHFDFSQKNAIFGDSVQTGDIL